jgi:hypothetical protein
MNLPWSERLGGIEGKGYMSWTIFYLASSELAIFSYLDRFITLLE